MKDGGKILFFEPMDPPLTAEERTCSSAPLLPADQDAKEALSEIVRLLAESGFQPVTQLMGYIIADDPTYLPEDGGARAMARRIGRDKLLEALLTLYLEDHPLSSSDE